MNVQVDGIQRLGVGVPPRTGYVNVAKSMDEIAKVTCDSRIRFVALALVSSDVADTGARVRRGVETESR